MFAEQDQDTLKSLVELNVEGYFSGRKNVNLDKFIQALMRNCPEKFHDARSLKLRRFFNEPRPHKDIVIPMAGCLRPYDEDKEPA